MAEILAIANSIWRRIMRMPVVYFLVGCCLVIIAAMNMYSTLSMNEHRPLMADMSMLLTAIAGFLASLSVAFDVPREIRTGAAATLLTKPLGRTQYLVGKLLGTCAVAVVITALLSCGSFIIYKMCFNELPLALVQGHVLGVVSVIPMVAFALFFSTFLTETVAAILTLIVIWLGFSVHKLSGVPLLYGGILPDMNLFNLRAEASYGLVAGWTYVVMATLWGVVYSIGLTALAAIIFNRRDIK